MFYRCLLKDINLKKLFTKEDKLFLHKILGMLSIFSFFYRYCFIYIKYGTLGFNGNLFDLLTFFVHYNLALTSLFFRILKVSSISLISNFHRSEPITTIGEKFLKLMFKAFIILEVM